MTTKKAWLDRCVEAVGRVVQNAPDGLFLCPLCLNWYSEIADVTFEHAPPKIAGGKRVALTCRDCNSTAGHQLDAHAGRLEDIFDFFAGKLTRPVTVTFKAGGAAMAAVVTHTESGIAIGGLPKNTDPKQHAAVIGHLDRLAEQGTWQGESMAIAFHNRWEEASAKASWLRAGYVIAFAALGYRYILRRELDAVRAQIRDPEGSHAGRAVLVNAQLPTVERALWIIQKPKTLQSVAVRMGRWGVVLPGLGIDLNFYERLAARKTWPPRMKTSGLPVAWPDRPRLDLDWVES
jgi:hypothetical protein